MARKYVPGCRDWTIRPLSDWISLWPIGPESVSRGRSVPLVAATSAFSSPSPSVSVTVNDQVLTWLGRSAPVISVNSPGSTCDRFVTPAGARATTVSGCQSEPRWTPLLSYKPASGTVGSATMRRPRYAGPDGPPAGSVTLKPAGDEKPRPVAS